MKLVFLRPLGIDQDIGVLRKFIAAEVGAAMVAAGANLAQSGASAASAAAASHQGRVYARWALHQQEAENERARQFQHYESSLARQWEEQMYNLYNSPSAMMRQYKEAGLNPYLAGQDALGSGMSQSAPMSGPGASGLSPGQPQQFVPDWSGLGNAGSAFVQAMGVNAQIANQEARTKDQLWQTYFDIRYRGSYDQAQKFAEDNGLYRPENRSGASYLERMAEASIQKDTEESLYYKVQGSLVENFGKRKAEEEIKVLGKQVAYLDSQIEVGRSQKELNRAYGYRVGSEIARNLAAANFDNAMAGQIKDLKKYLVFQAAMSVGMSAMDFLELYSSFQQGEYVRDWKTTPAAKNLKKVHYFLSSEDANFVLGVADGVGKLGSNLSPFIKRPPENNYNWNTYNDNYFRNSNGW